MTDTPKGNYAQVNGLNLYYEIYGQGEPLILLHGGLGAIEMFGEVLTKLAEGRQVIGVDLQAHGRTADIDRPMSLEALGDDVAALIKYLGFEKVDVMGYSMGGGAAVSTAIRHPEAVRRLVAVSFPYKRGGWYPEILAGMGQIGAAAAEPMKQTPMYQQYSQIAPRVEDWPVLLTKIGEMLRQDYDWSEDIKNLKMPVLVVAGDADSIRTSEVVRFFELLGGGQRDGSWDGSGISNARLAILPGLTHYNIFDSPALAAAVISFLETPVPA